MVRFLYLIGICALLAASGLFSLSIWQWSRDDPSCDSVLCSPSAVQMYQQGVREHERDAEEMTSPLVVQAETLAAHLAPAPPTRKDKEEAPVVAAARQESSTPGPAASSVKFRLHGTSYYPNQPGRSMALIGELGAPEGSERWVKEGAQLGHFVVHEIRRGAIVYRDGEDLREMAVERSASPPSLVRDLRPGSLKVSAAMDGGGPILPAPAGPNGVETAGGD